MLRRLLPALVLLPAIALGAAFGAWLFLAARAEAEWERWAAARRAEGWRVEHAAPERGRFGAEVALRLPAFALAAPDGRVPGGLGYRAEAVTLRLSWRDRSAAAFSPEGAQALTVAGAEQPLAARALTLRVALADGAARLDAEGVRVGAEGQALSVGSLWAAAGPGGALDFAAARLAHPSWRVLGGAADTLEGQILLAPASLDIRRLELRWGRVAADLSGRLAPDERRQPAGRLALRLQGAEAALDAFAQLGLLPGPALPAARALLRLSARPDPGDGLGPTVELPLELRQGGVTLARIPLARLPPDLEWR